MEIKKVGVVGAGVMGIGVGQSLAQSGMEAVLVDVSQEVLDRAKAEIRKNLRFQGMFQKDAKKEDPAAILGRIHLTTLLEDLGDVDFVVENVPEKWEIKRQIYPKIDAICPERAIFAVNTSCYSITRVGALTQRPDWVIGMHFMNPVPLKPMVEAIRGHHTSEATIETSRQFLRQMGTDC
ncbi:MAG TPA: 3-hydroxyacyl-CoA dehydrogenase NAD-binding domain-containing protein, partial [Thermoanaerobaculia bacterium]